MIELFSKENTVGVFRGFREARLEFHADLALPYQTLFQNVPMHGQLVVVQLETPDEAVLGRITSLSSEGRLAGPSGEEYTIRALREERTVPEELREDYIKYRVEIRVLGVVRINDGEVSFVPSHRRLPHLGSPVAFVDERVLQRLLGEEGAAIGVLALGEYVWSGHEPEIRTEPWMQVKSPPLWVHFPVDHLVSRRSFVFARAGFGKSNLNKFIFSRLYATTPTVTKRGGREVPVGTVIFDPDGEYFWPDDKGRPGLADVPELLDQLIVFTSQAPPSNFYGSFVAGGIKLDIRRLRPSDVISIALAPERQEQQNVRKLRGMNPRDWADLVDLIDTHGNAADLDLVQSFLHLERDQQAEALAARANMTSIVRMLHDRSSQLMDMLLDGLADGKLCVIDLSQLRGGPSLILSGLILRRIFDHNQEEFTKAEPNSIPTIAVVEEAQSVLNERSSAATPYIEWVKEGRKYDLGALLITQQPGSIPQEILSQGDNWFIFHLLSGSDLENVRRANGHFSEDLLSSLLNEPIAGQGIFWSSVGGSPFPVPIRVVSFESMYPMHDADYRLECVDTYASRLREKYSTILAHVESSLTPERLVGPEEEEEIGPDPLRQFQRHAIEALKSNTKFVSDVRNRGVPWGAIVGMLADELPSSVRDRKDVAYSLVSEALTEVFGQQDKDWRTERRGERNTLFVIADGERQQD